MKRFVEGVARDQGGLLPAHLEDFVGADNPVRAVDAFVEKLDLRALGFDAVDPCATGRPGYHPAVLLKLYIYGYLNAVPSSRRLEREAGRNVELMWLTERLAPDHKTIADFRRDRGLAIQQACAQFVMLCRELGLFTKAIVGQAGRAATVLRRAAHLARPQPARRSIASAGASVMAVASRAGLLLSSA